MENKRISFSKKLEYMIQNGNLTIVPKKDDFLKSEDSKYIDKQEIEKCYSKGNYYVRYEKDDVKISQLSNITYFVNNFYTFFKT